MRATHLLRISIVSEIWIIGSHTHSIKIALVCSTCSCFQYIGLILPLQICYILIDHYCAQILSILLIIDLFWTVEWIALNLLRLNNNVKLLLIIFGVSVMNIGFTSVETVNWAILPLYLERFNFLKRTELLIIKFTFSESFASKISVLWYFLL
jgi:hypothetical protein